jgi:hypothetical protein
MISASAAQALSTCPIKPQSVRVLQVEDRPPIVTGIRVWPRPVTWTHGFAFDGRWLPGGPICAAGALLADPYQEQEHVDAPELDACEVGDMRALLLQIPASAKDAIRPMPRVFAWMTLRLLGHVPEALDLVRRHPTLAGLVAFRAPDAHDATSPFETVRQHLGGAPESLLGLLGLPEDPRLVALLDGMRPEALRELGDDGVMELLQEAV